MKGKTSLLALLMFAVSACSAQRADVAAGIPSRDRRKKEAEQTTIELLGPKKKTVRLSVEIARSQEQRERGLMGRTTLQSDRGMLFLFPRSEILNFWMKNTVIPLDILFFDARGRMISSASMVPCERDPCAVYSSGAPAVAALEIAGGMRRRLGIASNWRMGETCTGTRCGHTLISCPTCR